MDRAGAGGGVAKPDLAGELGMRGGHEGCHLLMPHLHIVHKLLGIFERDVEAADAVAWIAIDAVQTPFRQALPDKFRNVHGYSLIIGMGAHHCQGGKTREG